MTLAFCPFCRTFGYYPDYTVERAKSDPLLRVRCVFCKLKFWPGNGPALLKYRQWWSGHNRRGPRTVCVHRVIARMSVRDLARKTLKKAARKTRMGRKKRRGW